MKTAVSIPDEVYGSAEALARRLRMSRSKLYATAVAEFVAQYSAGDVSKRLDEIYADEKSDLDPRVLAAQLSSLPKERW
jgi:metal-responsive CopG/Arc/MetJ family transcriptional regulator